MNVTTFLDHYEISENPFMGEEALHDTVFTRIEDECRHPDFPKVCGDLQRPASAIVFGEKGSGKTAMRMQIEQSVEQHNRRNPRQRCLAIQYDDLNPVLDRFCRHDRQREPMDSLRSFRLVDHMDAMLGAVVPGIVDQVLGELRGRPAPLMVEEEPGQARRPHQQLDRATKRDLLMLQLCYDAPDAAAHRTSRLKRM
ncbi:MAG: hypothetical protein ACYTGC_07760, partial [Planctomycetota bacterium]